MVSVLVSDKLSKDGIKILEDAGIKVDVKTGLPEDEIVKIVGNYDAMIVRSQTKVTPKIIAAAKKMKIIGRAGVGVDNIDLPAATSKGIIVVNSPEGNTIAAAEHTVAMLLSMSRNIPQAYFSLVKEHKWDRAKYKGVEVFGKTLGIVGLGKIGSHVAKCMLGMGMKVIAYDPFASKEHAENLGVELAKLDDVLKRSDYISLHIPKTDETKGMINKDKFKIMKKGVRVINCARGGVVVENDLVEACKSGQVGAAAVDVYEKEPTTESPMFDCPNIVAVPHLGASTEEAQVNVAVDVAQQIATVLNGGDASAPVNIPSMKPALLKPVKQYINLAEKIGKFIGQISEDVITNLEVTYLGDIAKADPSPLSTVILKGLLECQNPEGTVNFVNAPLIAKARGMSITETKSEESKDFANSITVKVTTKKDKHSVSGSLLATIGERITNVDGFAVDAVPTGNLLIFPNEDKPGIVGEVGTFLGKNKINIAGMEVGRAKEGGDAIMLINVDSDISTELLAKISKIKGIRASARLIKF
ncbi:phosphoglycerate dehydrogenase [Candidatus Margulisiibacteriota bacterium]